MRMTDADPEKTAEAAITSAAARHKRAADKAEETRKDLTGAVLDAMRNKTARYSDIARWTGWSPTYVRKFARQNGIDAEPEYKARTAKAQATLRAKAATEEATPEPREHVAQPAAPMHSQLPEAVARLTDKRAAELYDQAYGWATPDQRPTLDRAAEATPEDRDRAVVAAAYRLRLLQETDLRRN